MAHREPTAYLETKIRELQFTVNHHQVAPRQRMYRKSDVLRRAHELYGSLKAYYVSGLIAYHSDIYVQTVAAVDAALAVVGGKRNP